MTFGVRFLVNSKNKIEIEIQKFRLSHFFRKMSQNRKCRNGPTCTYYAKGRCWYLHTDVKYEIRSNSDTFLEREFEKEKKNLGTGQTALAAEKSQKQEDERLRQRLMHDEGFQRQVVDELKADIKTKLETADNTQDVEKECELRLDALQSTFAIMRVRNMKSDEEKEIEWRKQHDEEQKKRILSDGSSVYEMKMWARKVLNDEKYAEFDRACFKKAPENYLALLLYAGDKSLH